MILTAKPAPTAKQPPSLPAMHTVNLTVNGTESTLQLAPWTTLLDALREYLHLTGTKKGCDHGQCGACTVLIKGKRINSCLTLAVTQEGIGKSPPSKDWPTVSDWNSAYTRFSKRLSTMMPFSVATAHPDKFVRPSGWCRKEKPKPSPISGN